MHWKPNLLKSAVSVIAGIVVNFLLVGNARVCGHLPDGAGICTQIPWIEHAFDLVPLVVSLLAIAIVYIALSYFQKE